MLTEAVQYKDFVQSHENPILLQSDETVQNAVFDWFKYRYIGFSNQDKFLDILRRNVSINYPIYQQKLRIEPGVSQYDWLVQTYRERQLKTKGSADNSVEYDSAQTSTKTGNETNVRTGSQENVKSGSDVNTKSGGHITTDIAGKVTQTTSPHVQRVTKTENDHNEWSGNSQVQANNPMSESYSKFIEPDSSGTGAAQDKQYYEHAYQHMPALDWGNVSSQAQDGHRGYNTDNNTVTESYKYGEGVKGDTVTSEGDENNPGTSETKYKDERDTHVYNDLKDKTTFNDVKDTHSYNSVVDENKHTGKDTTHNSDQRTDREQMAGRNEAPADILARATVWIERSSAFKWFKEQIEPCFAPYYYGDEGGLI